MLLLLSCVCYPFSVDAFHIEPPVWQLDTLLVLLTTEEKADGILVDGPNTRGDANKDQPGLGDIRHDDHLRVVHVWEVELVRSLFGDDDVGFSRVLVSGLFPPNNTLRLAGSLFLNRTQLIAAHVIRTIGLEHLCRHSCCDWRSARQKHGRWHSFFRLLVSVLSGFRSPIKLWFSTTLN